MRKLTSTVVAKIKGSDITGRVIANPMTHRVDTAHKIYYQHTDTAAVSVESIAGRGQPHLKRKRSM